MITKYSIIPGKITEFVVEDTYDVDDVLKIIKNEYPKITQGILWNYTASNFSDPIPISFHRIALAVKEHAIHKKTAYLGPTDLKFGLLRMYETYSEIEKVAPLMKVFRDREEAIEWLKIV